MINSIKKAIEHRKKYMKVIKDCVCSKSTLNSIGVFINPFCEVKNFNGINYAIQESDTFVHGNFSLLCGVTKSENGVYIIFTDSYFRTLPKKAQDFFIYHEIGHMVYNSLQKDRNILGIRKRIVHDEIQADAFAASAVGIDTAIKSLKFVEKNIVGVNKKELRKRIEELRQSKNIVKMVNGWF